MTFNFQGKKYSYPSSLREIKLKQRIELHNQYGQAYDDKLNQIKEIEDETEQAIELTEAKMLFACQCFSFFTGIELDVILDKFDIEQVVNVYDTSLALLGEQESEVEVQDFYEFNGHKWVIESPSVTPKSKLTFNDLLTSKEIVRQLDMVGKGKFEALQYLCCIFLRKEGEEFNEEWIDEDSDRMKLMAQLPMDIALAVAFFLSNSISMYLSTLQFSKKAPVKESI